MRMNKRRNTLGILRKILRKEPNLCPLLIFAKWAFCVLREIGQIFEDCSDDFLGFCPNKWAFCPLLKTKVGLKNWRHFPKTALFGCFLALFGRFAQI